jgi:diguanylate cyclase (GGDEF)-like protein
MPMQRRVRRPDQLHRDRWRALAAAVHILLLAAERSKIQKQIAEGVQAIVDCDLIRIFELSEGRHQLVIEHGEPIGDQSTSLEEKLVEVAASRRRSASSLERFEDAELDQLATRARAQNWLCHVRALRTHDNDFGVVVIHCWQRAALAEEELDVLRRLIDSAAFALASEENRSELRRLAYIDPLTGLANRRRLDQELERHVGAVLSLLLVDFDGLKSINDALTYEHGDTVIAAVGHALTDFAETSELAARLAGDEFILLLPGANEERAAERAVALRGALATMNLPDDVRPLYRGASVGQATGDPSEDRRALFRRATDDLHFHKRQRKSG